MSVLIERIKDYHKMKKIREEIQDIRTQQQSPETIKKIQILERQWKELRNKYFEVYETNNP